MARKYKQGSRIFCIEELAKQNVIFFNGKAIHRGFFQSWQIRYAIVQIEAGRLFHAEKVSDGSDYDKEFWGTEENPE